MTNTRCTIYVANASYPNAPYVPIVSYDNFNVAYEEVTRIFDQGRAKLNVQLFEGADDVAIVTYTCWRLAAPERSATAGVITGELFV